MKKYVILLLAVCILLTLVPACSGKKTGTTEQTDTAQPTVETELETVEPEDESPYNLPAGKYTVDENGVPTAPYVYELPLTTSDEVFTYWYMASLPEHIPEEGYGSMEYPRELQRRTGVNVEYIMVSFNERATNFSILLAADDLPDLLTNCDWFYPGPLTEGVEEGYFANLYDYKEYMPNYYFEVNSHPDDPDVLAKVMPGEDMICAFWCMEYEPTLLHMAVTRGDWLEKLGMINDDIVTIEDFHNMLTLYKTEIGCPSPFLLYASLDAFNVFNCFDTRPLVGGVGPVIVVDGQVKFCHVHQEDLNFMTMINQWWNEGLIQPDWMSIDGNPTGKDLILTGKTGVIGMVPGEARDYEYPAAVDPDTHWVPLHKPVLQEGQVLHCGDTRSWLSYGSWFINADCSNIPLLVSYCDYFYSEEGIFLWNYGVEGYTYELNENGEPIFTDHMINHPGGLSWALLMYTGNEVCEGGISMRKRSYAYPGGERCMAFHTYWVDPEYYHYDGSMEWPESIVFTSEQSDEIAQYSTDMATYVSENYLQFVDGSKPLSEWDSYVEGLKLTGWYKCLDIYQQAYEDFIAKE